MKESGLIKKLNEKLKIAEKKSGKIDSLKAQLEEYTEKNDYEIKNCYRHQKSLLNLQKRISYLDMEVETLNRAKEIIKITSLVGIGERVNNSNITKNGKYYAFYSNNIGRQDSISGISDKILIEYVKKAIKEDIENDSGNKANKNIEMDIEKRFNDFIGKKTSMEVYRASNMILNIKLAKNNLPDYFDTAKKEHISINDNAEIKEWMHKAKERLNLEIMSLTKKRVETQQGKRGPYNLEINQIKQNIEELMKGYNQKEHEIIDSFIGFNNSQSLSIEKKEIIAQNGTYKGYALCQNGEAIARWFDDEWFSIIFSSSIAKPMKNELARVPIPEFGLIKELLEVKPGDYLALESKTKILNPENINPLYEKVKNGVEILPYLNKKKGIIRAKGERNELRTTPRPEPRHWGQEYLGKLSTGNIIEGEFFATGFTYQAFPVKKYVIVEANEENRATYIFDHEEFDSLRLMPRERLIDEKPDGYIGRILHKGSQDKWKKSLKDYLGKNNVPLKQKVSVYSFVVKK